MNERGQVFTLDMFFALTLTVLIVSYSGLALEQARRQAEEYAFRYSLERTANDAADVLVKTFGTPSKWWENAVRLETLGFAEENEGYPIQNTVDIKKFGQFRRLINEDNWDYPANASAVEAIKKLFGGSENFEVRVLDENENELWHAFPRWEFEKESGAENSLEVVVVRRLVAVKYGSAIRADSGVKIRAKGEGPFPGENLEFMIYPGELDAFDWYIVVIGGGNPNLKIYVNRYGSGVADYTFVPTDLPQRILPTEKYPPGNKKRVEHGGVKNDSEIPPENQLKEGLNFLGIALTAGPGNGWVRIYVVTLPTCSDWYEASMFIQPLPATLEVKMWR